MNPQTLMERLAFLEARVKQLEQYTGTPTPTFVPAKIEAWWKAMKPITEEMAKKGVIE